MNLKVSRRDFLKVIKFLGGAAFTALGGNYYVKEYEPSNLEVSHIEISLASLPREFNGFRILQISDIHIGGWMNRERFTKVVDLVLQQEFDLIVMTGDYVIGRSWSEVLDIAAEDFIEVITPLTQTNKVIAVMGNHDHRTDPVRSRTMLTGAGILELKNDVYRLDKDGASLYIAGLDDIYVGADRLDLLLLKLPADVPTILLVHEPDFADETSVTGKFLLQLSGHSHGGQVVVPFVGPIVLPRWARKYPTGLYNLGGMWLYTNRGVGMSEPFVRFNCRPEITVFTLRGPG